MYLYGIKVNNMLSFKNFSHNFDQNINILVGINGMGKSNLVNLINSILSEDLEYLKKYGKRMDSYIKLEYKSIDDKLPENIISYFTWKITEKFKANNMIDCDKLISDIKNSLYKITTITVEWTFQNNFIKIKLNGIDLYDYEFINSFFKESDYKLNNIPNKENKENKLWKLSEESRTKVSDIDKLLELFSCKIIRNDNPYNTLYNYINILNIPKITIQKQVFNTININDNINDNTDGIDIPKCDHRLYILNKLHNMCYNRRDTYETIRNFFVKMTNKSFRINYFNIDIEIESGDIPSSGERSLIEFLTLYYDNSINLLLIDEACNSLSSQIKKFFREYYIENRNKYNQLIFITHDKEMITSKTYKSINYFKMENGETKIMKISNKFSDVIISNPEVLFSNNILLVEGKTDFNFYKNFLEAINQDDKYLIIPISGKTSRLINFFNKYSKILNIKYKIIYDFDFIYDHYDMHITNEYKIPYSYELKGYLDSSNKIYKDDNNNIFINTYKSTKELIKNKGSPEINLSNKVNDIGIEFSKTHPYFNIEDLINTLSNIFIIPFNIIDLEGYIRIIDPNHKKGGTVDDMLNKIKSNINHVDYNHLKNFFNYD